MTEPNFVPHEKEERKSLPPEDASNPDDPGQAIIVSFRPLNPDPIVVSAAADRHEVDHETGQSEMVTVGGRIRIYRPGAELPVVDRFDLLLEHLVEPGDMALPGDWRVVVTNVVEPPRPRPLDYHVLVRYPGDAPIIALPLGVSFFNQLVAEKIRLLEPRLTIDTGRWTTLLGETGTLDPAEELPFPFDPPGAAGDVVRIAVRGTEILPRPRPGDRDWFPPRDDHGGVVVAEAESAPRRLRIFRPGQAEPLVDVTETPAVTLTVTEYEVQPGDLATPGPWRAVVSNPSPDTRYVYTIGRLVAQGSSRLEFGEAASQQFGLRPFTFPIAPIQGAINIRDMKSERIAVVFRGAERDYPGGSLALTLFFEHRGVEVHVNDLDFNIVGIGLDTGGVVDLANIATSIKLGFAVKDGGLTFGNYDVDFNFAIRWFTVIPEDLDDIVLFAIGIIIQAFDWLFGGGPDVESILEDVIQSKLRGMVDDVLDKELKEASPADPQMTLRKLLAKTVRESLVLQLPEGIKFYSVAADAETITFKYYFPRPAEPPRNRIRWPRSPGLERIDHIVVMMMENRSFDHMLGWMSREGRRDVDGLRGHEVNFLGDVAYRVEEMPGTYFPYDPRHHWKDREVQMGRNGEMNGFVRSFAEDNPDADPVWAMRYHVSSQVPVYRDLAARYMVADRWFSSLPAHTAINRLYYLAGESAGYDHPPAPLFLYDVQAVFRHLDLRDWIYYYHNVPSLWLCAGFTGSHPNIRLYEGETGTRPDPGFLARARAGTLPKVTFVDPRLKGIIDHAPPNDDHPAGDVTWGQRLVGQMYNALIESPRWRKTLFVVIYDEHGGLYDHRRPPRFAADDVPRLRIYGPRVPALILSPLVRAGSVSHEIYDHTSVAKTILSRFCRSEPDDGTIPSMTARVDAAKDLGSALSLAQPRAGTPVEIPAEPGPPPEDMPPPDPRPPAPEDFRVWVSRMENPASAFVPQPLVGWAAHGLCFDKHRGRVGAQGPTFLKRIRAGRWPINLTRVVVFRHSAVEGLPVARTLPLYAGGVISRAFKDNLKAVVEEASALVPRIYVQVCLFSYRAIRFAAETPEGLPRELRPVFSQPIRPRLLRWFDPTPGPRLNAQKRLVREIAQLLRPFDNVLWEIADEVRIDGKGTVPEDQCRLLDWLHVMRGELASVVGDRALITTSTAMINEALVFGHRRGPCSNPPFPAGFFDFHLPQWHREADLEGGISRAVARANGYEPSAFVILSDADPRRAPGTANPRLETWARAAFSAGAGYMMQPPVPFFQKLDRFPLEALADAHAHRAVEEHAYLVLYELTRARAERYRALQQALSRFANVLHLDRSAWTFTTPLQLGEVTDLLEAAVNDDEALVVLSLDGARLDGRVGDAQLHEWFQKRVGVALRPPRLLE